jgi:hypothetical protein
MSLGVMELSKPGADSLWRDIEVVSQQLQHAEHLEALFNTVDNLSVEQKTELVQKILKSPSLSAVIGNNQLRGDIVIQINTMDNDALAQILQVVAERIASSAR